MAIPCDSASLIDAAKCVQCIPPGMQFQVLVSLLCQIANNPSGGGTGKEFQSALFPVNVTAVANVAHGLGQVPQNFQARMVCVFPDLTSGMQVGDESEAACWFDTNNLINLFNVIATATNMIVTASMSVVGGEGNVVVPNRNGGFSNISSGNNFRIKIYANT